MNRALVFILSVFLVSCNESFQIQNSASTAASVCDGVASSTSEGFQNGDGLTEASAFGICTPDQLNLIANNASMRTKKFKLLKTIDMASTSFVMIGNSGGDEFSGVIDGQGYSINNLELNTMSNFVGFVRSNTGTIKNLHFSNLSVSGDRYVGGIVGENFGTIENCSVAGVVSGLTYSVGGIAGYSMGTVSKTGAAYVTVYGYEGVGGLVGVNEGAIANTFAIGEIKIHPTSGCGDVYGGLVGYQAAGTISKSYASAVLDPCGSANGLADSNTGVSASFWNSDLQAVSSAGTGLSEAALKSDTAMLLAGWDFVSVWKLNGSVSGYPGIIR